MSKPNAIGIDLGTTSSCVGVFTHGKVEIIPNEQGNRTTPSYVAFTASGRFIGEAAKNQATVNPHNTVFDVKRLIGRKFKDPVVKSDRKHWPFKVVNDGSKPKLLVEYKDETTIFTPEEISSMVLAKMKRIAETFLGQTVTDAVITVPAHFNDSQRKATKDAGSIAGLNVLRIINEPTAAALAYGMDKPFPGGHNVLIFDIGGGTCNVSILIIEDGLFEVKSTAGNTHLGGEDFDNALVDYFVAEFELRHNKNLASNPRALGRLRTACEQAKRALSSSSQAAIEIESLSGGIDFYTNLTRSRFEHICADLFRNTMEPVEKALREAKMKSKEIDDVVLVGGSTRIPKIQQLLSELLSVSHFGKPLNKSINPDEAVAFGAAVQAAVLSGCKAPSLYNLLLLDVIPFSLGIEVPRGVMQPLIMRNTTIPTNTKMTPKIFKRSDFAANNQTSVLIRVFEGESLLTTENNLLGKFELTGNSIDLGGDPQIEIWFDVDANGLLNVCAAETSTGKTNKITITITNDMGRLSKYEIERMIEEAERYNAEDAAQEESIQARNSLEGYAVNMKKTIDDGELESMVTVANQQKIKLKCNEILTWLDNNQTAAKEKFDGYQNELETLIKQIFKSSVN